MPKVLFDSRVFPQPRCLIPRFDGTLLLWNGRTLYGTSSSRQRHDHAHHPSSNTSRSEASTAALSRELGINPKTVAKWRQRQTVEDMKTGPKEPRSTVLSGEEEAVVVAFRRHTLLPLDNCLYALQPSLPHLTARRCTLRRGKRSPGSFSDPSSPATPRHPALA